MIPEAKLAWMAAIFDMKGRINRKTNQSRATPQLVLRIDSASPRVIEELCRLTGGSVEIRDGIQFKEYDQRGCTEHCPAAHIHHDGHVVPEVTRWTITGAAAAVVLHNVIPYMVTDRGLEDMMNEALANLVTTGQGSGAVRAAVRRLAQLGWELPPGMADRLSLDTATAS
jgi:hypothetical protein